jgi:hypothetical protein
MYHPLSSVMYHPLSTHTSVMYHHLSTHISMSTPISIDNCNIIASYWIIKDIIISHCHWNARLGGTCGCVTDSG